MKDEYICKKDAIKQCGFGMTSLHIADNLRKMRPAAVAPVVHAYWIQTSAEDENGNAYYYCSNCGRGESHNPIVEVPYCWKRGAKMDKHGEG